MSYPGELDRFFERILGCPLVTGRVSVSVGLDDLGTVAGLCDVKGQSDYPRKILHLEQQLEVSSDGACDWILPADT